MIYTVTLNPAVDKTVVINDFSVGTVNRISSVRQDAGGKGINVSKVIASLGGRSIAMGLIGGASGGFIKEYLDCQGIENDFVSIQGETRTNLKIVDGCRGTNTDINEPGPAVRDSDLNLLLQKLLGRIDDDSIVVFSGSVPNNVDKVIYARWIEAVKLKGAKTVLDADGELLKNGVKAGLYLVKPNIHELGQFFDADIDEEGYDGKYAVQLVKKYARQFVEDYGIEMAVVSLGEKGAIFVDQTRSLLAHGLKVDVKSTAGAGDAMVAALAYSMDNGDGFEETVRLAMACSAANVTTSGTQAAERWQVDKLQERVSFEHLL
jgi:1-phosphofructokinase